MTELPHIILKPNQLVGIVVRDIVMKAGRGGSRGCGGCIPPPAILKHVFDLYNFFTISNFSITISLTPIAHIMKNVRTKCIIQAVQLAINKKMKKNDGNLLEKMTNLQKKCAAINDKNSRSVHVLPFLSFTPGTVKSDVQFSAQNHVKSKKKGHHVRRP